MENRRLAFFGTPELTLSLLDELMVTNLTPVLIVTGEDKPQGRKMVITPPPVKVWALERGIPLLQPKKLDREFIESFKTYRIELSVVVAYGKIIPEELIALPELGTVNVHYSLLPKFRGATPVEAAILTGETHTGVTIQHMRYELDSGPIIQTAETEILPDETGEKLRSRLNQLARPILVEAINNLFEGRATLTPQDSTEATFCKKIKKEDGEIRLDDDATINYRKFRAYFGWPGTYFFTERNALQMRVLIKDAVLENGKFVIKRVLPEGKKEMSYEEFLRMKAN